MPADTTPSDPIPGAISPKKAVEADRLLPQAPSTFESYMQTTSAQATPQAAPAMTPALTGPQAATPLDLAKPATPPTTPTLNTLLAQSGTIRDTMGTIGDQLNQPNLKLRRSQNHLVKNKLQDTNGYLRATAAKLGVEKDPLQMLPGLGPIARFLAYLGDGQDQLVLVQKKLKELSASKEGISPGDMMYLQIKMSQAQQETEYTSLLLGKVIQSITQLLQTQL